MWHLATCLAACLVALVASQCSDLPCLNIKDCPLWRDRLEDKVISEHSAEIQQEFKKSICGFGDGPKVCCRKAKPPAVPPRSCGRILVGGDRHCGGCEEVASPGQWPWVARILYGQNSQEPNTTFCGGALVSPRHVITAAHCASNEAKVPVAVLLGEHDVATEYDCITREQECGASGEEGRRCLEEGLCAEKAVRYEVANKYVHPKYKNAKPKRPLYDVALLELERPVEFSPYIQPVCLPLSASPTPVTGPLVLKGWGNTVKGFGAAVSARVLQELKGLKEVPLEDEGEEPGCHSMIGAIADLKGHHMCVWKQDSGANACPGDSGGPVSRLRRAHVRDPGSWELAGVISFGVTKACASNTPLVLTRIENQEILSWLQEVIGEEMPKR